ncbi:MAG: HlyD family efflux transporter periplasmic adaptor subunit [Alphaproteobacteria bacterium]|nr:HlyD family efflux transporter periplasmic adaptor subunit [Alphaproteobacteria bacterium]
MQTADASRSAPRDGERNAGDAISAAQSGFPQAVVGREAPARDETTQTPGECGQEVEKRDSVRTEAGLASERRSERQFVRAQLPMEVEHRGATYPGFDISLTGFSCVGSPAIDDDVVDDFAVHLLFHGYRLTVKVKASRVRQIETEKLNGFQIIEIDDAQADVLRKVLRAHLSGQLITLDGVLTPADSQTARQAKEQSSNDASKKLSGLALWRRRAWYLAIAMATSALVLVLAASLFQRFAVVYSAFATVTAPKLDIDAPSDGEIRAHRIVPGDPVERDQLLVRIHDRHLDAELELARKRLATTRQLLGSVDRQLDFASPTTLFDMPFDRPLAIHERRISFEAMAGLEQARLSSLELRSQANHLYSPCACTVLWAVPAGGWVEKGDLLVTLVRTDGGDLLIEALVPLRSIDRIQQGQVAFIELPDSPRLIEARVEHITMDPLRQPRAGLPAWLRQDKSLASVLLRPSRPFSGELMGRPMQVIFSDWPAITIAAAELRVQLAAWAAELGPATKNALRAARQVALTAAEHLERKLADLRP